MFIINQDAYDRLSRYESHLRKATYCDYLVGFTRKEFDVVYNIYRECGGNKTYDAVCGRCCMQLCKEVGKEYFHFKESASQSQNDKPVAQSTTKRKKTQNKTATRRKKTIKED